MLWHALTPIELPANVIKLVLVITDVLVVFFVLIILVIFAFCPFIITLQFGREVLTATLGLHASTQCLQMMTFLSPFFKFLVVPCALFGHLENIAVRLIVFPGEREVLFFKAFGLFRHLLHLFAESKEEFVAVVQRILHLNIITTDTRQENGRTGDHRQLNKHTCLNFST